jgi:hypothetical protein
MISPRCLNEDQDVEHIGSNPCPNCRWVEDDPRQATRRMSAQEGRPYVVLSLRSFEREKAAFTSTPAYAASVALMPRPTGGGG